VVDHELRIGQQPGRADRRGIGSGGIDGHVLDALPESRCARFEPCHHGGAAAAFMLPQKPLITGQVNEPGVPGVDPHPPASLRAALPSGLSPPSLVDAQHRGGRRLGQHRLSVGDKRPMRGRPRHAMGVGDLGHRPRRVPDRFGHLLTQPKRATGAGGNLGDGLGERPPLTVVSSASPANFVPAHHDTAFAIRDILRGGDHPVLHRRRHHPARRARRRRRLVGDHIDHPGPVAVALDTLNAYSWQPEQHCRSVRHSPWLLPGLNASQHSDSRRPRASAVRHAEQDQRGCLPA